MLVSTKRRRSSGMVALSIDGEFHLGNFQKKRILEHLRGKRFSIVRPGSLNYSNVIAIVCRNYFRT
jgi:hypothetical protein